MKRLLSIMLVIVMLITLSVSAIADKADYTITVAINAEFAPFEYYENGKLTGFDIDLMNEICNAAGYEIEYLDMPFDSLIYAVELGKADCAISTITYTEERDMVVDFSVPYLEASYKR